MRDPVRFLTLEDAHSYALAFRRSQELLMTCDECGAEFYGPPLVFDEDFWMRVELAAKFCSSECAIRSIEAAGMAKNAADLR